MSPFHSRFNLLGALALFGAGGLAPSPEQTFKGYGRKRALVYKSQGKRECERRKLQIANGELTAANGLDLTTNKETPDV